MTRLVSLSESDPFGLTTFGKPVRATQLYYFIPAQVSRQIYQASSALCELICQELDWIDVHLYIKVPHMQI